MAIFQDGGRRHLGFLKLLHLSPTIVFGDQALSGVTIEKKTWGPIYKQ